MIERPSRLEAGGILLACVALLITLTWLDGNAARRHQEPAAERAAGSVVRIAARLEQAGERELILLPGRRAWGSGAGTTGVRQEDPGLPAAPEALPGGAAEPRERAMALGWLVLIAGAGLAMAGTGARVLSRRWA